MSQNYDNWERLVGAVLRREQFRQLCRDDSSSSSFVSSFSSDFSSSFHLSPPKEDSWGINEDPLYIREDESSTFSWSRPSEGSWVTNKYIFYKAEDESTTFSLGPPREHSWKTSNVHFFEEKGDSSTLGWSPPEEDTWETSKDPLSEEDESDLNPLLSDISPSSSSFRLNFSFSRNPSFDFANPKNGLAKQSLPFQTLACPKNTAAKPKKKQESDVLEIFEDTPFAFGVETLLKAPSNNLREETESYNQSFVVRLQDEDVTVVVKRLIMGKVNSHKILEQQMKIIGSISHDNLVKLRGYYLFDCHAFGVYDYFSEGSLSTMLYGKGDQNPIDLDWETRMRIAVGAATGLAHIHKQCSGKLVHGNVKASNIFVNSDGYGCVADLNLSNILKPSSPTVTTLRGYRPPEVERSIVSQACDVYSFGVLLLELIIGKSPRNMSSWQYSSWAAYKARHDWTVLVYDRRLLDDVRIKKEMQRMLKIALSCVEYRPEKRTNMHRVVKKLEAVITGNQY